MRVAILLRIYTYIRTYIHTYIDIYIYLKGRWNSFSGGVHGGRSCTVNLEVRRRR